MTEMNVLFKGAQMMLYVHKNVTYQQYHAQIEQSSVVIKST